MTHYHGYKQTLKIIPKKVQLISVLRTKKKFIKIEIHKKMNLLEDNFIETILLNSLTFC